MMKRALVLIALFFSLVFSARSGDEKFQMTLMLSPTAEWVRFGQSLNASVYNNQWGTKLSYNFGFEYKHFFDPSLSFSTGLMYMNKGFRNQIFEAATPQNPNPKKEAVGATLGSAHIAAVPLYINVHHRLRRKVEMIYTAGIAAGYLFSERARNNYYSDETNPQQGFFDLSEGASNVNLFVDYYVGAHIGVGISAYFKRSFLLIIQPMYKHQLHDARDYLGQFSSNDPFSVRMNSFGIDVKLGYFFTKQIKDRQQKF
ncbi:MAG: hypothetical protein WEC59_12360 [Salibacteraceae bacterium]